MALTLGMTGMDRKTEAEVQAAFKAANAETGNRWVLVSDDKADYIVIDMDSLYGPMSWLRLHAAGRKVIGLTSVERSQTDYRLTHPISASDFSVLLSEIAGDSATGTSTASAAPAPTKPAASPPPTASEAAPIAAPVPAVAAAPEPIPEPVPEPEPVTPPAPVAATPQALLHWLAHGRLRKRVRLQQGGMTLLIDPIAAVWHGSATLKPLAPCFDGGLQEQDFEALSDADWAASAAALGAAQPLQRLHWLGGLLSGFDTPGKYQLKKWPQTEREFPKHFRIATVMMKGPATIAEIAEASGVATQDVADFVNANLATGYAQSAGGLSSFNDPASQLLGRLHGN